MGSAQNHLYVLILAGGGGTRLWPMSREAAPKQFLKLINGKSLYSLSIEHALKITSAKNIFVITNQKHREFIEKESGVISSENIIYEPQRRDTALAYATGATYIANLDPNAVIINLHSDNLITPVQLFSKQSRYAANVAAELNQIVTIGIKPRFPHTGMGHIHAVKKVGQYENTYVGNKFVEKPDIKLAKEYTESGEYFWNSGMYVWPAKLLLDQLKIHSPKTVSLLPKLQEVIGSSSEKEILSLVYQMAPSISIDYALSEKLKSFICYVGDFHWTDVGDWKEVWNNLPQDEYGNAISGSSSSEHVCIDSENNLLFLNKKLIATVGLRNMVVVDTPDALLICPRDSAQSVKKIVELLKVKEMKEYL